MGVYTVNQTDGSLQRVAGGTLYADAPIGAIQSYGGVIAPAGWLICDGSTLSRTEYAELFAVIGINFGEGDGETTFGIPDLRECVPVGVGKNITKSIANHDRYDLGQFKDDALGTHNHPLVAVTTATFNNAGVPVGIGNNNTPTSATHGKQLGVNYIIKAKMVGVPADLEAQIDADYQKKDLAQAVEGETTVEDALGALSTNKQPKTLDTPLTIGGSEQTTVEGALGGLKNVAKVGGASSEMTQLTNEDLNDITTEGWYFTTGTDSLLNKPTGTSVNNNIIHVIKRGSTNYVCQHFYCANERKEYFRFSESGQWTLWRTIIDDSVLTSSVTSGSNAPVTSGGVYEELYKAGGIVIADNLKQGANTFSASNISNALGGNFVGLLVITDRRNNEIGAIYFVVMGGSSVGLLRQIVSNRATLSESNGTFTYNDSAGLSSSNMGKVTAYKLAYY